MILRLDRGVALWLAVVCGFIYSMVLVGGITRLTGSGLSMTDWRPLSGVFPPLSDEAWVVEFDNYKRFPEYKVLNKGMTLGEFKSIYFWEYLHRMLGRALGLIFAAPLAWFWFQRRLSSRLARRLTVALALGAGQGLLGWYMVQSGLVNIPHVSHYRLAAHLSLALFLLVFLYWTLLDRWAPSWIGQGVNPWDRLLYTATCTLVVCQIVYGALTAGLNAGLGYNTFPTMNGYMIPPDLLAKSPTWLNFFENPTTLQFTHRLFGWIILGLALAIGYRATRPSTDRSLRKAGTLTALVALLQFGLGIATLLSYVPVHLALLHQSGACVLLMACVLGLKIIVVRARELKALTPSLGAASK